MYRLAYRYRLNKNLCIDDLAAEGYRGIMRAIEKFDPSKGVRFSTYASFWVQQKLTLAARAQASAVR